MMLSTIRWLSQLQSTKGSFVTMSYITHTYLGVPIGLRWDQPSGCR